MFLLNIGNNPCVKVSRGTYRSAQTVSTHDRRLGCENHERRLITRGIGKSGSHRCRRLLETNDSVGDVFEDPIGYDKNGHFFAFLFVRPNYVRVPFFPQAFTTLLPLVVSRHRCCLTSFPHFFTLFSFLLAFFLELVKGARIRFLSIPDETIGFVSSFVRGLLHLIARKIDCMQKRLYVDGLIEPFFRFAVMVLVYRTFIFATIWNFLYENFRIDAFEFKSVNFTSTFR